MFKTVWGWREVPFLGRLARVAHRDSGLPTGREQEIVCLPHRNNMLTGSRPVLGTIWGCSGIDRVKYRQVAISALWKDVKAYHLKWCAWVWTAVRLRPSPPIRESAVTRKTS